MHAAIPEDIPLGLLVARNNFALEVEVLHQPPERGWKPRALRPSFEKETVPANGGNNAAGAILGFKHESLDAELL